MKRIPALLLLSAITACAAPLGTEPTSPSDAALGVSTQLKAGPGLVIERVSGDCASGITVRVTGTNLSARSRYGHHLLSRTDNTGWFGTPVELGTGNKKSVVWEEFWPSSIINPAEGAKFKGWAQAWVTDAWTGFLHETPSTFIGGAC